MSNLRTILRSLQWLAVLLVFSGASGAGAGETSSQAEPVRRDLVDYPAGQLPVNAGLEAEVRALREELHQMRESQDSRLRHIEDALEHTGKEAVVPPSPVQNPPPPQLVQPANVPKALSVCSQGCDFNDLQKAVDAAPAGGEVEVAAEINGTCAVVRKPLRIVGKQGSNGRRAHLAGGVCMGKAALVTAAANITIEGFEISGISVGDGNGACIRLDKGTGNLTIRGVYCHDSQDGILGASEGRLLIENSVFTGNGFGNGQAHGVYLNGGQEALIRRCRILAAQNAGHLLKSGARKLTVEDSILAALNGRNSRVLDAFAGGEIVLRRNIIQQGPESDNSDMIGLALESSRLLPDGHAFLMEGNWLVFDKPSRGVLIRGRKLGPISVKNNTFVGLDKLGIDGVEEAGNRWFATRKEAGLPAFDGTPASLPALKN